MRKAINLFLYLAISSLVVTSCVPSRQYQDLKDKNQKNEDEKAAIKSSYDDLLVKHTELAAKYDNIEKAATALSADTTVMGISLRKLTKQYDKINSLNDELLKKQGDLLKGNAKESRELLTQLQKSKEDLQNKEDAIKEMERNLDIKKKNLETLNSELELRNKRLVELEGILSNKDSIVNALKTKVSAALTGFEGNGLTIVQKNGKVYVSLEEKLLFKSASTTVDPKGVSALKKLAKVLETNWDINVMVEGHTDDVPYVGSGQIKDNWDLSAMRATSITKILLEGTTINPARITTAGRGEYSPIDPAKTKEARQKNRRTEIILTPKLDELLKILETN